LTAISGLRNSYRDRKAVQEQHNAISNLLIASPAPPQRAIVQNLLEFFPACRAPKKSAGRYTIIERTLPNFRIIFARRNNVQWPFKSRNLIYHGRRRTPIQLTFRFLFEPISTPNTYSRSVSRTPGAFRFLSRRYRRALSHDLPLMMVSAFRREAFPSFSILLNKLTTSVPGGGTVLD